MNTICCKVPDVIVAKLDQLAKELPTITYKKTLPSRNINFKAAKTTTQAPTYALTACEHALTPTEGQTPTSFKPVQHEKTPMPPLQAIRSQDGVVITQYTNDGTELATLNYPSLIADINS